MIYTSGFNAVDYIPPYARRNGLVAIADDHIVQSIVEVARMQKGNPTNKELVSALEYYLDNDAFLEFDEIPVSDT